MSYSEKKLKIFSGGANPELVEEIANYIGVAVGAGKLVRFSDGEIDAHIEESVRGADVFVVQSTCPPVNEHLMELLVMVDAFKRASVSRINAVIPYYGYARKDRKTKPRDPITAKLVADLLTTAGVDRVLTMDLHAGQIAGFFDMPVDPLVGVPVLAKYFTKRGFDDEVVVVSPDVGGVVRARDMAARLNASLAIIDKRRPKPNVAEIMSIIGDVEGKIAILVDDLIDTGGTLAVGARALLKHGAKQVYACGTHAVFSGAAVKTLTEAPIEEIIVTNTIPLKPEAQQNGKFRVLSVGRLFGEAIARIHKDLSVSKLFD